MASNVNQHNQLLQLFAAYAKRLDKLYDNFVNRLIASLPYPKDEVWERLADDPLFRFDQFPYLSARLQHIFDDYVNKQVLCYKAGITDGVALAFSQDKINLGKYTILQDEAIKAARNAAVASFIANRMSRKEGLSLSDKVWNYSQLGKSEVEMGISNVLKDGLKAGTSAEELGRKVRQYLNNPTMMYRRYWVTVADHAGNKKKVARWYKRNIDPKTGKVTFSDEPLEKVGMGVYRSARMNGYRLMRTEINMSYHKANASRWANEPFVYGIRIWLSPQHPKYDICDELVGEYPKTFVFSGFHPNCLCASSPMTLWGDEKKDFYRRLMKGEDMSNFHSKYEITEKNMNPKWKQYIHDQHKNIFEAGKRRKLAYFLRDNQQYWINTFSAKERKQMGLEAASAKDRIKQIADARHIARTEEQAKNIADRWHEHKRVDALIRQARPLMAELKEYPSVASYKTLQNAINARNANVLTDLLVDKAIAKKLAYEKMITPDNLKWSEFAKHFTTNESAVWAHNSMTHIVKEARQKANLDEALKFFKTEMKLRLKDNLIGEELKIYKPLMKREEKRMTDWFDFQRYSKNLVKEIDLINKNAQIIGGAFKEIKVNVSDFYLQDVEKMKDLVNNKYFKPYTSLYKMQQVSKFVASTQSPIVHQLWDGIINAYRTNGINADVDSLFNQLDKNIDRLKKVAAKKAKGAIPSYMQTNYTTAKDLDNTIKSANATLSAIDKWFQHGDCQILVENNLRLNGSTDIDGKIWLQKSRIDKCESAMMKLAQGKVADITKDEADAIATLWHEITHNRNILGNMVLTGTQRKYMELANEFVARKTLPEFYTKMGAKSTPHSEFITSRHSTNYNGMVTNYDYVIDTLKLDRDKVINSVKKHLFNDRYTDQKQGLISGLIDGGITYTNGTPVKKSTLSQLLEKIKDQKDDYVYSGGQYIKKTKEEIIDEWLRAERLKK